MMTGHTPRDPDFEERVRTSFDGQNMMRTMGMSIASVGPGFIDIAFNHDDRFAQQHGFAHGGFVATSLDSACGFAALTLMVPNAAVLTVEYKINYLRPARADAYRASAHVVKSGRTLTYCEAALTAAGSDEALATMTGTLISLVDTGIEN